MTGIVLQLQMDCFNPEIPITELLRKALLVARKLQIKNAEEWILLEMNGYGSDDKVPAYRMLRGRVMGESPYHGTRPIIFESKEEQELFSAKANGQSIGEIQSLLANARPNDSFHLDIFHEVALKWMKKFQMQSLPFLHVQTSELSKIITSVHNRILDWSSQLEAQGIIGDGFSFSEKEKDAAKSVVFNIGTMVNSQIQHDVSDSTQTQSNAAADKAELLQIIEKLKDELTKGKFETLQKKQLEIDLSTAENQINAPKPNRNIISEALLSAQRIFESAAGGAIGVGLSIQAAKILPHFFQ